MASVILLRHDRLLDAALFVDVVAAMIPVSNMEIRSISKKDYDSIRYLVEIWIFIEKMRIGKLDIEFDKQRAFLFRKSQLRHAFIDDTTHAA
jgi:hypothetical protein